MSVIPVTIKHAGKTHSVSVNIDGPATTFKNDIQKATGVPAARMKVMVKGGMLKDDADLSQLQFKPDQTITVIGTAEPLPQAPTEAAVFIEDMDDNELALTAGTPAGLVNLGNTCYLNASLQVLRTIPELQVALDKPMLPAQASSVRLTNSLKSLVSGINQTTSATTPISFLTALREVSPQFAERDRTGQYAQQDADEAWTLIVSSLAATLGSIAPETNFIDQYLAAEITQTLTCDESADEAPTTRVEKVLKLSCNISGSTNFMSTGILDSLDQKLEKRSPSLGRDAMYSQKSRLSRLPVNLAIHQVRFYWRSDIGKKAKIMRKVKFPLLFDALDLVTDDLRAKMTPINIATKNAIKARDERAKVRRRTKQEDATASDVALDAKERSSVDALVRQAGLDEPGCNASGLYDLTAMVTHKGASADSGHYIGWSRKSDDIWYKFDDAKVTEVPSGKIMALEGGGEDSVAYILLYRAVAL